MAKPGHVTCEPVRKPPVAAIRPFICLLLCEIYSFLKLFSEVLSGRRVNFEQIMKPVNRKSKFNRKSRFGVRRGIEMRCFGGDSSKINRSYHPPQSTFMSIHNTRIPIYKKINT